MEKLEKIDDQFILDQLKINGGVHLKDFFSREEVDGFLAQFSDAYKSNLNNNNCGLVYYNQQKFVSQTLVHSRAVFDYLTSKKIFGLLKLYLGKPILKATRYYLTGAGAVSMWHQDEKNSDYTSTGMIMIIYLSDVINENDGPFEFINGSHNYSSEMTDEQFFVEKIESTCKDKITTVFGRAGTLIFADSRVIHRAKPHNNKLFRKSIFIQVSKFETNMYKEMLLVNPSFLTEEILSEPSLLAFLGFGIDSTPFIYPVTSMESLPLNFETLSKFYKWFISRAKKQGFELLPVGVKKMIRNKIGSKVDYDSIKK